MNLDRRFVLFAYLWALLGLGLGVRMGMSMDHSQLVTHAHIMLVGFVVSFLYGTTHRLYLGAPPRWLAELQFWLHQLGALVMLVGLFILFAHILPEPTIGPVLGMASIAVLLGMALMAWMVFARPRATAGL